MANERVEYRVVAVDVEDGTAFEWTDYEGENIGRARESYASLCDDPIPFDRVLFQRRKITTSSWRAVRKDARSASPNEREDSDGR